MCAVNFSLRKTESGWKAWDVVIEGISYVKSFRTDFGAEIQQKGLDEVIQPPGGGRQGSRPMARSAGKPALEEVGRDGTRRSRPLRVSGRGSSDRLNSRRSRTTACHWARPQSKAVTPRSSISPAVTDSDSSGLALLIEWLSVAKEESRRSLSYENMPAQLHQLAGLSEVEGLFTSASAVIGLSSLPAPWPAGRSAIRIQNQVLVDSPYRRIPGRHVAAGRRRARTHRDRRCWLNVSSRANSAGAPIRQLGQVQTVLIQVFLDVLLRIRVRIHYPSRRIPQVRRPETEDRQFDEWPRVDAPFPQRCDRNPRVACLASPAEEAGSRMPPMAHGGIESEATQVVRRGEELSLQARH